MIGERRRDGATKRRRVHGRDGHATGFTLVELVLALALTVVVASILSEAMFTVFRAKNSVNDSLDLARTGDNGTEILWEELTNSLPPTPATATTIRMGSNTSTNTGSLIGPFEGTENTVDFFTSGPEPRADLLPDVREVQYVLVDDPESGGAGGQMLVRRVYTNVLAMSPTTAPDDIVCHGVLNFTLSYCDGTNWTDVWDSVQQKDTLPTAVQVTLELAPRRPNEATRLETRLVPVLCGTAASSAAGGG